MLAVVVADVEIEGEYHLERRQFGSTPAQLRVLAEWLLEQEVEEVVMESTAQYWKPVWGALERHWKPVCQKREGAGRMSGTLHLAQAQSNRARRGRKNDFADAERLVKRLVAQELTLSFVPDPEQRLWRTVTRTKYQLTCNRVRLQNRLEALLVATLDACHVCQPSPHWLGLYAYPETVRRSGLWNSQFVGGPSISGSDFARVDELVAASSI